jgi:SAM-dependent methyltransferase
MAALTPDGSPVEAYRRLPAEPELSIVRSYVGGRRRVLDLGAGTGRIADPLALAGNDVVAVDESPEMVACIQHARGVVSRIEDLELGETFDVVLLLSHLINTLPDQRAALLTTAERHLADDGIVIAQRHDPARRIAPGRAQLGDVAITLDQIDDARWPTVSAVTTYGVGGAEWPQPWTAEILDDAATSAAFEAVGLTVQSTDGPWVVAVR